MDRFGSEARQKQNPKLRYAHTSTGIDRHRCHGPLTQTGNQRKVVSLIRRDGPAPSGMVAEHSSEIPTRGNLRLSAKEINSELR
jgi:hypothetical protein